MNIGLQLYTVGEEMAADPAGTLAHVAAAGYQDVELSPFLAMSASDLRGKLKGAGLQSSSGHYMMPDLLNDLERQIEFAHAMGQQWMVVTVPWINDPSRVRGDESGGPMGFFLAMVREFTLDDWKWNAEQFNRLGEQIRKAGLTLGYHNHNFEFRAFGDTTGYDEFLRLTDPALVKLELDCGWVTVAGQDPIDYLKRYPERYDLLHIKDFQKGFTERTTLLDKDPGAPVPTELGRGAVDYRGIVGAARKAGVQVLYVEQEPPFVTMPALEAIRVNFQYLRDLTAALGTN